MDAVLLHVLRSRFQYQDPWRRDHHGRAGRSDGDDRRDTAVIIEKLFDIPAYRQRALPQIVTCLALVASGLRVYTSRGVGSTRKPSEQALFYLESLWFFSASDVR